MSLVGQGCYSIVISGSLIKICYFSMSSPHCRSHFFLSLFLSFGLQVFLDHLIHCTALCFSPAINSNFVVRSFNLDCSCFALRWSLSVTQPCWSRQLFKYYVMSDPLFVATLILYIHAVLLRFSCRSGTSNDCTCWFCLDNKSFWYKFLFVRFILQTPASHLMSGFASFSPVPTSARFVFYFPNLYFSV